MGAVLMRARAQLRGRLRTSVLLAVFVGLAGGVVLAAVAGARRSDAALPRFLAGRLPDERRAEEAVVDEELAKRQGLAVGATWRVQAYTMAQFGPAGEGKPIPPEGPTVDLRVVGIVRHPRDLLPVVTEQDNIYVNSGELYLTPAFWRRYGPDLASYGVTLVVALERGAADLPRLAADVERRFPGRAMVQTEPDIGEEAMPGIRRAIALESGALLAFAALAGLAALLLVGQTLGRQAFLEAVEYPTLRALGMSRGQLVGVAVARSAVVGVGGAAVAVAAAVALSPLAPIGVARRAELDPGVLVDVAVLGPGAFGMVALVAACAAVPAWRAARTPGSALGLLESPGTARPSRLAGVLACAGLPAAAITGVRLALDPGRGRTAVPVRSAIAGAAAAVFAVVAAAGLGASVVRLGGSPARYGWTWDVAVGNFAGVEDAKRGAHALAGEPAVAAFTGLTLWDLELGGRPLRVMAIAPDKGEVPLAVVEGREPAGPGELVLGVATMRTLGLRLGDTVTVAPGPGQEPVRQLRVVGRAVLNAPADTAVGPGKGAVLRLEELRPFLSREAAEALAPQSYLVRLDRRADRGHAIERLWSAFPGTVVLPLPQTDVANLQRVAYLPGVLAALVCLLATGTVTHALISSIRRRRRDLAVLKAMGFARGQVSATVAWQATAFAAVALLVGLPLGVATGRWGWWLVADQLGVAAGPVVPPLALLAVTSGALAVANLVAAGPGWAASRIQPATALRSE